MKKILLLIIAITGILACKVQAQTTSVWTEAYEAENYNALYNQFKTVVSDSTDRKELTTYMIKRFKTELPNGFQSVSVDSLSILSEKMAVDYYTSHANKLGNIEMAPSEAWTPVLEKGIRQGLLYNWPKKDLVNRNKYCDCYIRKLKAKYPAKVPSTPPHDVILAIDTECKAELKTH